MTPLYLLVHAADSERASRIEEALHRGAPGCVLRFEEPADGPLSKLASTGADGLIRDNTPAIDPTLRHELNNHLALIRMLAEVMNEAPDLTESQRAKIREMGAAAEAAALALRKTKSGG